MNYDQALNPGGDLQLPVNDESVFTMCPYCGGNNLHHDKVAVFFGGEMSQTDIQVVVDSESISEGTSQEGNPSSRRDGILIRFWCETCENIPTLSITQHKGSTFLYWSTDT